MCEALLDVFRCVMADKYVVNCGLRHNSEICIEGPGRVKIVTQREGYSEL